MKSGSPTQGSISTRPPTSKYGKSRPLTAKSTSSQRPPEPWKFGDDPLLDPMGAFRETHPITKEDIEAAIAFFTRGRQERAALALQSHNGKKDADPQSENSKEKDGASNQKTEKHSVVERTNLDKMKLNNVHAGPIRLGKEDIYYMIENSFPDMAAGGSKILKMIMSGKEEVSREQLVNLLVNRSVANPPFEEAFQFFHPEETQQITVSDLKKVVQIINPHHLVYKNDITELMKNFDRDLDGALSLDDFKRISINSKDLFS
ncbi:hypothetical protein HK098_008027 [Nowakowskiella sp. JEL0407]|nr:hypothetical protein HK098_008027 [Nowakowskiella sp. JEL0407]